MPKFTKGHKLAKGGARPNPGPIPAVVREACRLAASERVGVLASIIDDPAARDADRVAAWKALAGVGLPQQLEVDEGSATKPNMNEIEAKAAMMLVELEVPERKWPPATLARYKRGDFNVTQNQNQG